ncbi:glycoside hydrolase family 65 protein [Enterococcus sp. RIT-PI-f]|uniref:glycoside hydrolase family 65 protein n=1 Tax=Enterococcus sp. RIT-PI-f TaxID=1690244 RepID=UPI0006B8CC5E|nr:glycoside hydrolase family 65 protein [Enterococcus sp. RIT-PI-f]KPG73836.1 maltose phosphorylase [Enterococcus sp. RIT-PI-f]
MVNHQSFQLSAEELPHQTQEYLETLFAVGNGQIGARAGHPLKVNQFYPGNPGVFVNGFFDSEPIQYGEWAYGYAKNHQTICKLPNLRGVVLRIGQEKSSDSEWQTKRTVMNIDLSTGVLTETYHITTPSNKQFDLHMSSFASMTRRELYACRYTIKNCDFPDAVELMHTLDQSFYTIKTDDPRVANKNHQLEKESISDYHIWTAPQSNKRIALRLDLKPHQLVEGASLEAIFQLALLDDNQTAPFQNQCVAYSLLLEEQRNSYRDFWEKSDILISGNEQLQKGIRFNLFHLNQGAGRDGKTNFAAKGLTGEGYEGHYFWDTEMYLLPFFVYTHPEVAKQLLTYRGSILPQAKARAQELGQSGALFAWRTIDGNETSAYYPAGTAQLHINADIVYGFQLYERVTGDQSLMEGIGKEVVFETAKFWLDYGTYAHKHGQDCFGIHGVTGPDEYSALVNNNFYTNKMVQNNLYYASELAERYGMYTEESSKWLAAADAMYFGFDEERKITQQDDCFLDQAVWPFEETPADNYPLLLHYHPMIIYKYQVCKQADTVLAEMLFTGDFSLEQLARDYDYYEKVTTHDSSLSRSIFSVMASRIGDTEKAYSYFMDTALMDLTDLQKNVVDGIHAANMGGSWLSLIYGFAGLYYDQGLRMTNHLPKEIEQLSFTLTYLGESVKVTLDKGNIACVLQTDSLLSVEEMDGGIRIRQK